jgi:biotin carboxyl carrier protein
MARPGRRAYLLIALFALALVILPFLFWYATWFGRKLSDSELDRYFADREKPRHAQHALVQLGERLSRHQNVARWYPQVVALTASPNMELRQTAAWIMGQDRAYDPFHDALRRLVQDPVPMVRRNAALSLAGFGDHEARPELAAMLRPFTIRAPASGRIHYRLKVGEYVNPGTLVARIGESEVRAAVPGEVRSLGASEGAPIGAGQPVADLAPDQNHVWEALRALYLVGEAADLDDVRRFTRPVEGMPEMVQKQAANTLQAIESRPPAP